MLLTSGPGWRTGAYAVDLLERTIRFRPATPLPASAGFTLQVDKGLRSAAGCGLGETAVLRFRTGRTIEAPATPVDPTFSVVAPIFERACQGGGCHGTKADCQATTAAARLPLCRHDAPHHLVGVAATQDARLARIAPFDSARSYLLRKLLPGEAAGEAFPGVVGHHGPIVGGATIAVDELRLLRDWIDRGAR